MNDWTIHSELVGKRVLVWTGYYDEEEGIVVAVSTTNDCIKVRSCEDGKILVGNQYEEIFGALPAIG